MTGRSGTRDGQVRRFTAAPGFTADFFAVRDFLVRVNADRVRTPGFLWARWEWAFVLPFLDSTALDRIGVWERDGRVVALATFEEGPGEAWLVVDPEARDLLPVMVDHAVDVLAVDGRVRILVPDDDPELAALVAARGLVETSSGEPNAVLDLVGADLDARPPDGWSVQTLADEWDLRAFHRLMHRGFDHPGEPDWSEPELTWRLASTRAPDQRADLQVLVRAPGGYAAFAGTWWWPGSGYAMVEPVCTDPAWRGHGAGRVAVLEAARRCRELGARAAYVGSGQDFYRRLGFEPTVGGTWWSMA